MDQSSLALLLVLLCIGSGVVGVVTQRAYPDLRSLGQDPPEWEINPPRQNGESTYDYDLCLFLDQMTLSPVVAGLVGVVICLFGFGGSSALIALGLFWVAHSTGSLLSGPGIGLAGLQALKFCLGLGFIFLGGWLLYSFPKWINQIYRQEVLELHPIPACYHCRYYGHEPDLIVCALHPKGPESSHCPDFSKECE